jgi:coenzyme PQQ synthesis protein D (PqqD)
MEMKRQAIARDVRFSFHEHGLALLHIGRGQLFIANRTGARVWRGLSEAHSVEEIAEQISREYNAPLEQVSEDTREFLAELWLHGFLTRRVER